MWRCTIDKSNPERLDGPSMQSVITAQMLWVDSVTRDWHRKQSRKAIRSELNAVDKEGNIADIWQSYGKESRTFASQIFLAVAHACY